MTREFLAWLSILVGLFLAAICWLIAYPTYAQESQPTTPACAAFDEVVEFLEQNYREKISWVGRLPSGVSAVLFSSPEDTWTLAQTNGATACIIFAGKGSKFTLGQPV